MFALGTFALGQFHRFRISTCCLLAVTTVLFCDAAQTFYYCKPLRVPEHTLINFAILLARMYLTCVALHSDMSPSAVIHVCLTLVEQPVCAVHIEVDAAEATTGSAIAKQVLHFSSSLLMCCSAPMLFEDVQYHLSHKNDC